MFRANSSEDLDERFACFEPPQQVWQQRFKLRTQCGLLHVSDSQPHDRRSFFWDGRETSLERQVLRPIEDPNEMDLTLNELEGRLREITPTALGDRTIGATASRRRQAYGGQAAPSSTVRRADRAEPVPPSDVQIEVEAGNDFAAKSYREQFREVFGQPPSAENIGQALASYVRVLLSADSPFDRFQAGEAAAMSEAAQRGLKLFRGKANCTACHSGPLLSDEEFHNTGVGWAQEPPDFGRFEVTQREPDRGRFKTPSLRDVALTAPYMHNGSLATLAEVVEFYNRGGGPNPNLDREIRPLNLTPEEKADLAEFLKALSGRP